MAGQPKPKLNLTNIRIFNFCPAEGHIRLAAVTKHNNKCFTILYFIYNYVTINYVTINYVVML